MTDFNKIVQPAVDTFITLLEGIENSIKSKEIELDRRLNEADEYRKRLKSQEDENAKILSVRQDELNAKIFIQRNLNQQLNDEMAKYDSLNREIESTKEETKAMFDNAKAERDMATQEVKKQRQLTTKHADRLAMLKLDEDKLNKLRGEISEERRKVDTEKRVIDKKQQELVAKEHELVDRELEIRKLDKKVKLIIKQREIANV